MTSTDTRFDTPLYTVAEAARFLAVPTSTFSGWARGYVRRAGGRTSVGKPVLSLVRDTGDEASVPFIGLAEGMVLAAIRRSGVPMQRIRPALLAVQDSIGIHHALASERLYTDGAEVLSGTPGADLRRRAGGCCRPCRCAITFPMRPTSGRGRSGCRGRP